MSVRNGSDYRLRIESHNGGFYGVIPHETSFIVRPGGVEVNALFDDKNTDIDSLFNCDGKLARFIVLDGDEHIIDSEYVVSCVEIMFECEEAVNIRICGGEGEKTSTRNKNMEKLMFQMAKLLKKLNK